MGYDINIGRWENVGGDGRVVAPNSPLGSFDDVIDKFSSTLPDAGFFDDGSGIFETEDLYIEFYSFIKNEDGEVMVICMNVRGQGDPTPHLEKVCEPHGWSAVDESGKTVAGRWKT